MKKTIVLLLVLAMLAVTATPVMAGGNGPGNGGGNGTQQQGTRGTFAMTGTITAIGANTVTIQVYRGNNLVRPYLGTQVTLSVSSGTRYLFSNGSTSTAITFADLRVGNPVSANGTVANNIWTTTRITVGANLACLP